MRENFISREILNICSDICSIKELLEKIFLNSTWEFNQGDYYAKLAEMSDNIQNYYAIINSSDIEPLLLNLKLPQLEFDSYFSEQIILKISSAQYDEIIKPIKQIYSNMPQSEQNIIQAVTEHYPNLNLYLNQDNQQKSIETKWRQQHQQSINIIQRKTFL